MRYRYNALYHFRRYINIYENIPKIWIYLSSIYRDISQNWHIKIYQFRIYRNISRKILIYRWISRYILIYLFIFDKFTDIYCKLKRFFLFLWLNFKIQKKEQKEAKWENISWAPPRAVVLAHGWEKNGVKNTLLVKTASVTCLLKKYFWKYWFIREFQVSRKLKKKLSQSLLDNK